MQILALDLGKYKSVACEYEAESGRHSFVTLPTTPQAFHDLIVDREHDLLGRPCHFSKIATALG